jgi:Domain of unknown function (DUF1906)
MPQIVDYSTARPDPASLAAAGFIGAARYLATLPNPKVIDGPELAGLFAAGLSIAFVWEVGTDWTSWNGAEADRQLDALGVDQNVPVYWAVDRDWSDYPLVGRMLDGVNSRRRRGIYGGSGLVQYQLDNGHAEYGWVAAASSWGHGQPAPGAALQQRVGGAPAGCDVNDVLRPDWGQQDPKGNDVTPEEHDMIVKLQQSIDAIYASNARIEQDLADLKSNGTSGAPAHFTGTVDLHAA